MFVLLIHKVTQKPIYSGRNKQLNFIRNGLTSHMLSLKSIIFRDVVLFTSTNTLLEANQRFKGTLPPYSAKLCWSPAHKVVSGSAYSLTLKMEVTCSSEMSVDF
jgi:hypothetical protein